LAPGKLILVGVAVVALAVLGWQWAAAEGDASPGAGNASSTSTASDLANAAPGTAEARDARGPFSAAGLQTRQQQLMLWQARYQRAEAVYASYRDATRYPPDSHPIGEHPDQVRPFDPVAEEAALLDDKGKAVKGIHLRTTQERVFLSGTDTVKFTIEAVDDNARTLPLTITRAAAQSVPDSSALVSLIHTDVNFSDDGTDADAVAQDGKFSALFKPAQQGFAGYAGTIRLLAQVNANGEQGVAHFDVIYTSDVPATWAGVREALVAGSLNFYLKVNVLVPGRYVISARVDDAHGVPFALLQYNDVVAAGAREFKLQLFGALVRDKQPSFPLHLRDVDGFLLIPDKFPDRAMMARRSGVVYVSGSYARDRFSSDEWTSEERARYLAEYGKDAENARRQMQDLQGG
jgi:hypothetical protein